MLYAWITVFLGVDPRTDVTLHVVAWSSLSRYSSLFPERADPHDLAEQLAIIRERSLHPDDCRRALCARSRSGYRKRSTTR